jgi:hypothetical protein
METKRNLNADESRTLRAELADARVPYDRTITRAKYGIPTGSLFPTPPVTPYPNSVVQGRDGLRYALLA